MKGCLPNTWAAQKTAPTYTIMQKKIEKSKQASYTVSKGEDFFSFDGGNRELVFILLNE